MIPAREFAWRAALGFALMLICFLMIAGTQWIVTLDGVR